MFNLGVLLSLLFVSAICWANPLLEDIVMPQELQEVTNKYRLPTNVEPTNYKIDLVVNMRKNNFNFDGVSYININVRQDTRTLVLNARNLTIRAECAELVEEGAKEPVTSSKGTCKTVDETETLEVTFPNDLKKDKKYILTLIYKGVLDHEDFHGFYLSTYLDEKNEEKYVATTHFEPASARRAFPCWDEPQYKATFEISLEHSKDYHAISNTPGTTKEASGGNIRTTFEKTPKMSTYLVAFVISQYKSKEAGASPKHKVWVKPHAVESGSYALDMGQKVLKKLDEYTGLKYSDYIKKMDQIAIQNFSAGAMENWGLVTYREESFLYTEGESDLPTKQDIVTIIAHEFAHQWFGNLVSPKWWTYLWLNEGFATYFQYYIADQLEPSWRLMEYFAVKALQASAFVVDAKDKTRPMNQDASAPPDIRNLFDTIAYQKAGSVIRMMSHFLTEKVFQDGLKTYLSELKLDIANSDDLFDWMQEAISDKNIKLKEIMNEWVNKPGYPVIYVEGDGKETFEIKQKRFSLNKIEDKTTWHVPLTWTSEDKPDFTNLTNTLWLKPSDKSVKITKVPNKKWVIFNLQQTGYYRVNYDENNWSLLTEYLSGKDYSKIHPVNRAQLLDDSINLAHAGELSYDIPLKLMLYLNNEVDFIPWTTAFRTVSFLNDKLGNSKEYETFKLYLKYIMKKASETVQFANGKKDDDTRKLLRINLLKWACKAGVEQCTEEAEKQFKSWLQDSKKNPLDINLKNNILCAGLRNADEETWNKTLNKYHSTEDVREKKSILTALACSNSESILTTYLTLALDETSKIDNFQRVFEAVLANNPIGVNVSVKLFIDRYEDIKTLVKDKSEVEALLPKIAAAITNKDQYATFSIFLTRENVVDAVTADAVKKAAENIIWLEENGEPVEKWLKDNKEAFTSSAATTMASILVVFAVLFTQFY